MSETVEDVVQESILYEVLEYFIKKQEPELTKFKNDSVAFPTSGTIKNALRYLNNRYSLPETISQQVSYTLPWKFAIGDKGRILAILQENIIEIRKSKDEYSSVIGKASAPKDFFPQWRRLVWSPDGSILALASSNGYVSFYNSFGNNIFNISPKSVSQNPQVLEAGDATASMIFKKPRVKTDSWDYEFIRVTYSGLLKSYCISSNGYSENHEFSFGNFYRNGVNSVSYSERHNLFFVAGNSVSQNLTCTASQIGLTCWRTLNDHPYYKLSVSSQDNELNKSNFSIWQFIPVIKSRTQSLIFKTSISHDEQLISCLHTDGSISIWSLPTLKMQKQWKLPDQPDYNAVNPLKTAKFKRSLANGSEFQPIDIGWWSNNAVIISRYSGSISVCGTNNLKNLLGASPEFMYSHPQIAELDDAKGFLCLDCEVVVTSTKRNRESNSESHTSELSSDSEKDEDDSQPVTILNYTTNLMQSALYSITDIEKFQPKRKRSKVFHRTYRLLGLKSTTPEELYTRKIEIEEYGEALSLAKTYNLDPDLVYQTQWRKSEFSIKAIQEHLSKVSKRSWVLNECVSRVPEALEATRELLNFGLRGANLETLIAIGIKDDGKFTFAEVDDDDLDENNVQLKKLQKINQKLDTISKDSLNESQKELIRYRKRLLDLLDKLQTYEILLESPTKFDKKFYEEFRLLSPVENAVKFAKRGNFRGVEIMFTYYGAKLMPHWLMIISFFPETLNPEKYQKLLPECDIEGRLFLLYQQEFRPKDWVERSTFSDIIEEDSSDDIEYIYEDKRSLLSYRNKEITPELLQKWYKERAYEIERDSRLVDNSLTLINIGKSHNVENLENLLFELETLDDLVYKVGLEELSLTEMEKLNDLQKIKLLMTKSDEKNFVANIKNMVLPYTRRKKRYLRDESDNDLLNNYLINLSKDDLTLPMKFFESLKLSYDPEIYDAIKSITILAIECIYASKDAEMYPKAKVIFDAIVSHASGREEDCEAYKELEKELKTLQTLNKYQVYIPLYHVKVSRDSPLDAKVLLNQMSENLTIIYFSPNEKNWSQLLNDMLDIQEHTLTCLDANTCFEIVMVARLKSKSKIAIQGCQNLMEFKKTNRSQLKVSYERAVDLILQASNDYFNNSKSLTDPDMDLARECLNLVSDDDQRIKEEQNLIESLQILNEFNINILPVQVRLTQNRIKLIEDCLSSRNDAYKNKQKLLNLSKYLRVEHKNNRFREGKVLNLIAKKSLEMKDFNFCSSVVKQLMKMNYQSAWDIALDMASCDDYSDLQFRRSCVWFAINNGPSDMIENLMKRANLLQVQILNSDLEKWMPVDNDQSDDQEITDKETNDVFNTPQTENKEFVPKIVQTSTELVKSSAQMVKQSTFDLIKNASNTDFWKSKLNFNFADSSPKPVLEDEVIHKRKEEYLQKFACFYETLHTSCGISNLDTKYSKYSQTDYNSKLKLCQILLRISLLSETASYGAEISDINHLLLECAEHTIAEDCTMGLSYLLSLDDDNLREVMEYFENLPETEFLSQILAYFCSIKLFSKIHPEATNIFLDDPMKLISFILNENIEDNNEEQKLIKQQIIHLIIEKQEKTYCESLEKTNSDKDIKRDDTLMGGKSTSNMNIKENNPQPSDGTDGWDNWGDEWTEEWTDTSSKQADQNIEVENPVHESTDGWTDEWTDTASKLADQNLEVENLVHGLTDGWADEWTDMPNKTTNQNVEVENPVHELNNISSKSIDQNVKIEDTEKALSVNSNESTDRNDDAKYLANEWTEEWNDIPNKSTDPIVEVENLEHNRMDMPVTLVNENAEVNSWDDEWIDLPDSSMNENIEASIHHSDSSGTTVEERLEIVKEKISRIENMDDYEEVKKLLLQWPNIIDTSSNSDLKSSLVLQTIEKVMNINKENSYNDNDMILHEITEFLQNKLIPQNIFTQFLDVKKDMFTPEQLIYLQLSSKEPLTQQTAIEYIKKNYKKLTLNTAILEEIFFSNFTSSFGVNHDLYYKILEEVFTNRTLPEIEDNVKLLIDNLTRQRNIPHAIALMNQLEGIPPSLSTYDNCFQLLLRK